MSKKDYSQFEVKLTEIISKTENIEEPIEFYKIFSDEISDLNNSKSFLKLRHKEDKTIKSILSHKKFLLQMHKKTNDQFYQNTAQLYYSLAKKY